MHSLCHMKTLLAIIACHVTLALPFALMWVFIGMILIHDRSRYGTQ
jgi:hypothetical protein